MESRYNCGSPRDMVDSTLIERILGDDVRRGCGCYGSSGTSMSCDCGGSRRENRREERSERREGCGCGESRRDNRREERSDRREGCGCGESRRENRREEHSERREGCGCGESRRDNRREERSERREGCGCGESRRDNRRMEGFPIAMAYVPEQEWRGIYEADEALENGTLFNELNLPFNHSSCGRNCGCR